MDQLPGTPDNDSQRWYLPKATGLEIVPFTGEHLAAAAEMVAANYRKERLLEPALPARFETVEALRERLRHFADGRAGVVAIRDGTLAGFLAGLLMPERGLRLAYAPDCGHAVAPDCAQSGWPEGGRATYRALYAALAPRWVANGYFEHAVSFLAGDRVAADAWFSLGFGVFGVDALRDLSPVEAPAAAVDIRRATEDDVDLVIDLTVGLQRHLAASPIFMPMLRYRSREYFRRWLADPATPIWLAYLDGRAAGHIKMGPVDAEYASMPHAGEATVAISGAFAWEDLRSRGIGTALLKHALGWARAEGYCACAVDFESANIVGMDFWRRSGFRAVDYAVWRHVDERIAWAGEHRDRDEFLSTG